MTKPQLVKVEALFYVLQQVIKRSYAYFDTAPLRFLIQPLPGIRVCRNMCFRRMMSEIDSFLSEIFISHRGLCPNFALKRWRVSMWY